jgi:hypothetical protein
MSKELNQIHLFINDNKYYLLDIDKKTVLKAFNLSDFLIELFESDNVSIKYLIEFLLDNNSESLYKVLGNELSKIGPIKYRIFSDIEIDDDIQMPLEVYSFKSQHDFILFTIYKAAASNIPFNKCKNCGKYFVPTTKSNEIYCTRVFRNGKTCRDIGYEISVQSDEIAKIYRNAYKTQNAKKQRNKNIPNIEKQFSNWASQAKEMYKFCKDNKIKLDEFSKWLKDHQDWISK